jgi:hypothetical protein
MLNITKGGGNNEVFIIFIMFKVLRFAFSYASLLIAKNFTAQIYMEKVLVKGENPPKLTNLMVLAIVIEFIMVAITMALVYAVSSQFELNVISNEMNVFIEYLLPDYIISTIMTFIVGYVIATKMHDKKYFLYKDDGLRAIRALGEVMFTISVINIFVPWNYLINGLKQSI